MKRTTFLLTIAFCCTFNVNTFSWADNQVLNAEQVQQLFNEKKMTVTDPVPDKKTREISSYEVSASSSGLLRVTGESGSAESRVWTVREDGAFCFSRPITRRRGGATCGYLVPSGAGSYDMYLIDGKYSPKRKIVGAPGSTHILTFSDFK